MKRLGFFLYLIVWLSVSGRAQVADVLWSRISTLQYSFVNQSANEFINPAALDSFYYKLSMLRHTRKGKVSVVHIGDSHLQADGITSVVRNDAQAYFGDAGRGLVFPYQIAGSNAPLDLKGSTNTNWKCNKIITNDKLLQPGICGYVAQSKASQASFRIYFQEKDGIRSAFNRMRFFMTGAGDNFTITDSALTAPVAFNHGSGLLYVVDAPSVMHSFHLTRTAVGEDDWKFYGVSLEKKDASGLLYHTIGVNGARLEQYVRSPLFWNQLKLLDGDLFIISLGTNEAQNPYLQEAAVALACDSFLIKLHEIAPTANVLITVPGGSYYQAKKPNKSLVTVQNALKHIATKHKAACWDLLSITGGLEKIPEWKKHDLLAHDLVHYTNAGYRLQGELLQQAMAHHYNLYTSTHTFKVVPPAPIQVKKAEPVVKNEIVKAPIVKKEPTVQPVPPTIPRTSPARDTARPAENKPERKSNIIVEYHD